MVLAIWDDWQTLGILAAVICVAYLAVLWVAALAWTYRDAAARTRDPILQTVALLLVLVFNLPGLLVYLILRPKETLADQYDRQLEAEALLHELQEQATCPTCRRRIENDFAVCPYCRSSLRTPCASCARPLHASWVICPYCAADRAKPADTSAAPRAPRPTSAAGAGERPIPMPQRRMPPVAPAASDVAPATTDVVEPDAPPLTSNP
jgi:RNA polymerase subunit RPABC4/transcription elongation factor Spt4